MPLISSCAVIALCLGGAVAMPAAAQTTEVKPPAFEVFGLPPTFQPPGQSSGEGPKVPSAWEIWDYDEGQAGGWGEGGSVHATSPWAEDYSFLGIPNWQSLTKRKPGFLDPLKYIPVVGNDNIYISFSGEERLKDYYENEPVLGNLKPPGQSRNVLRSLYGMDVHVGTVFRAFVQLVDSADFVTTGYGARGGKPVGGNQRSVLDVQQAFVEAKAVILGAQSGIMFGRQDYYEGPPSMGQGGNAVGVHTSYDGFRIYAMWPRFRISAIDFAGVTLVPESIFDNYTNWQTRYKGIYTSTALPHLSFLPKDQQLFFDAWYWDYYAYPTSVAVYTAKSLDKSTQSGPADRDYAVGRFWGNVGPVELDWVAAYEFGQQKVASLGNLRRPISAYGISTRTTYAFPKTVLFHPTVGSEINYYSGGDLRKTRGAIGTFTDPFATPDYYSVPEYVLQQNVLEVAPEARLYLLKNVSLYIQVPFWWRASLYDTVYGTGETYNTTLGHGRYVGTMPQLQLAWGIGRYLTLTETAAKFIGSKMMTSNHNADSIWLLSNLDFRF